jgi:hypothetical protein
MSNIPLPLDNSLSKPLEDLSIGLNSRKDSNNNTLPFFAYIITIDNNNNNNLISMAIDDTTQLVDIPITHPTLIPPNDSTSIESLIKTHISDKLKTLYTQSNNSIDSQYSTVVPRSTAQNPSPPAQLPPLRFNAPRNLPVNTTDVINPDSETTLNSSSSSIQNQDDNSTNSSTLGLNNLYRNEDTSNSDSIISSLSQSKIGGSSKSIKKRRQRKKERKTKRRTRK